MPSRLAFFLFHQVILPHSASQEEMSKPVISLLKAFTGKPFVNFWNRWCMVSQHWEHIQFHFRYLSIWEPPPKSQEQNQASGPGVLSHVGINQSREQHKVQLHENKEGDKFICFIERRVSLGICTSTISDSPSFATVVATDSQKLLDEEIGGGAAWAKIKRSIVWCREQPGLSMYQAILRQLADFQHDEVSNAIRALSRVSLTFILQS